MARALQVTPPLSEHAEGPVWWPAWGGLRWVDLLSGDLMSLDAGGTVSRRNVGAPVLAAMRPRTGGGSVLALERGFALEDPDGTVHPLPEVWSEPTVRMNDGGADPHGRFYCGSMHYDEETPAGALFRLTPDGTVTRVLGDVTISNGLEWSPNGDLAYYNDTLTHRIDVFDCTADGGLADRRPFVRLGDDELPDGLTVDSKGGVWVALYGSGTVRHYDPDGTVQHVVEVPARNVTACTFGGDNLGTLYITTSRRGVDPAEQPGAGAIFAYEPGVLGQPARTFAG